MLLALPRKAANEDALRKPTISDLARAAGVSVTTVSHAFSGRRHVDPETRKRLEPEHFFVRSARRRHRFPSFP